MSATTLGLESTLRDYLLDVSLREPKVLRELREQTARLPEARMQISPEQGQFMALLARAIGARQTLEVGTFTGYSAICTALALPPEGRLYSLDLSPEYARIARAAFDRAGVGDRIEQRIGPALPSLDALVAEGRSGTFDLAFIDADKENYLGYYERCLQLLRPNGLVLVDNVLWGGAVIDPDDRDPSTEAIRAFNRVLHADERVDLSMLPLGDGLTLARKR
ncbi:MAG: class I SAM-dependent methyltransferase [Cyanobacteria bacterium REEB65]|nr:class I SAM-dependent methyltransferase [Cyanobacteria bacterium REEB65]